jgi:hypothetical protein
MDSENKKLRQLMDKVEEALRESETKFRLLFEQSLPRASHGRLQLYSL